MKVNKGKYVPRLTKLIAQARIVRENLPPFVIELMIMNDMFDGQVRCIKPLVWKQLKTREIWIYGGLRETRRDVKVD